MAGHDKVAERFSAGVYLAHAGKPWQRGTNENTNGLLGQYFPKGQHCAGTPSRTYGPSRSD